jgi:hypothetical protein
MSLATLIELKLVGTFVLFLGVLGWQWLSVRRALRRRARE